MSRLKICPQYLAIHEKSRGRIDVLIDLVYQCSKGVDHKAVIVIEDKIDAALTEQLKIYIGAIESNEKYVSYEKHYILFKTGYYDTLVSNDKFRVFCRDDLSEVLSPNLERSEIITDFKNHLEKIEYRLNAFKRDTAPKIFKYRKDTDLEDRYYLTGFHRWLFRHKNLNLSNAGYGYVNNTAGGFNGFWWDFEHLPQNDYWSYLQWENDKLCYKIGFSDEVYRAEGWKSNAQELKTVWSEILLGLDSDLSSKNTKIGQTMTVAKLDKALSIKADNKLDLDYTIATMVKAQEVLKEVRQRLG